MYRARRVVHVLLLLAGACQAGSARDGADGRFELTGDRHRAVVTGETLAIGRLDAAAPRAGLGATRAAGLPSARATVVEDEGALAIERGWARELLVNGDDGIEQSWTFAARPPGGDLELCVPTVGLSYLDSDRRGLRFAIDGGDTVLRYGHATWVTGDQRVALPARFRDGCIVLGVPSAVLDAATYPAVLDPVISVEYGQPPAAESGPAQGAQENPALVWGDTAHLVAWSDSREATGFPSVYAVLREWSAIPADHAGVRLGPGLLSNTALVPAVAHTDGIFAVAWATHDTVFFVRVDESGHVLDAPARALHVGGSPGALGIAARDGQFFVVWLDRAVSGDLRGTRVTAAGVVLDATPLVLTTDAFEQRDLRLRASPDGYWALFTDDRSGNRDVQLLPLSAAGAPLAAPVAVSTRAGTQRAPDVAFDGAGGAIAVWDDEITAAVHGAKITLAPLTIGADTRITGGSFESGARIGFADGAYTVAMRSQICGQACPVVLDLPASGPVRVDGEPLADGRIQAVDLAVDGLGVEVVWDETSARTLGADIMVARPQAGPAILASRAADTQLLPQAAAMSSHFLAAWLTPRPAGVQVHAARISGLGELEDDAPILLSGAYPAQGLIGVASLSQTALVVWNERRSATGPGNPDWRVMASRVTAGGVAEQPPMQVDNGSSPMVGDLWVNGTFPARFVLTHVDGDVVYDQDIRETGTPAISRFVLEDPSVLGATWIRATAAFVYYFSPTDQRVHRFRRSDGRLDILDAVGPASSTFMVAHRGGDHAIVYQDNRTDPAKVSLLVHDDSGVVRWHLDSLATGTGTLSPRIIGQSDGYFVIWRADGGIVGQRFSAEGALIDAAPAVISNEPGVEALGAMVSDIVGRTLVVYSRFVAEPGLNAHRLRSRVIDFRIGDGAGPGATCSSGFACASGYCVDGVCCDQACGFGADDCQACARAAGAPTDGTCAMLAATVVCREAAGACDAAETCTGSAPTCPVDAPADAGNACGDRARGDCDADDVCDGVGFACPDVKRPSGSECRASAGVCDPRETCDGATDSCPADRLASGSTCRAATGACDVAEVCDGASAGCPGDAVAPATSVCRDSAGACDVVETCDGQAVACPPDVRAVAGTVCRAGAGDCDVAEACDGAAAACPDDAYAGPEVQCRDADGACDVAERCTGSGRHCPADDVALDGTSCADALGCNGREVCRAGACVAGAPLCDADQTCSEATDVCTPTAPPVEDGGCGCSADGAAASTGLWMLLLVLPLARRRRVRSRSRTTGR